MPLQTINFANAPYHKADYSGVSEILPNILEGYQLAQTPAKMREEQRKAELANALAELQFKYAEPKLKAELAHKQRLARGESAGGRGGAGGLHGVAREAQEIQMLREQHKDNPEMLKRLDMYEQKKYGAKGGNSTLDADLQTLEQAKQEYADNPEMLAKIEDWWSKKYGTQAPKASGAFGQLQQALAARQAAEESGDYEKADIIDEWIEKQNAPKPGAKGGGAKSYTPSYLTKQINELEDVKAGYLPGSNRSVQLDPAQQEEYTNRLELAIQKYTTDTATRANALRGNNLVQSIDSASVDDLVRYSGPTGWAKLKYEQAQDIAGNPSEEYIKHKEAKKAVELEAQELRQFLGTSITPDMNRALKEMVDATSPGISPETAKRMVEKSRGIIKKQVGTFQKGLKSTKPYNRMDEDAPEDIQGEKQFQTTIKNTQLKNSAPIIGITPDGRRVNVPADRFEEFISKGGKRG